MSVYWFIWDLFLIFCFLCRTLRWFPNHFGPRERRLFIYVVLSGIFPLLPQAIPCPSLSCLAWSGSPLSHLPTGQKISAVLKTSKCNRTWRQHAAMSSCTTGWQQTNNLHYDEFMLLQYVKFPPGVFSSQMRPLGRSSPRHLAPTGTEGGLAENALLSQQAALTWTSLRINRNAFALICQYICWRWPEIIYSNNPSVSHIRAWPIKAHIK